MNTAQNFVAGGISRFYDEWEKLTSDPWVLKVVQGVEIPFLQWPLQDRVPFPYRLSLEEKEIMTGEVRKLEGKGVIQRVLPEQGQFVSNVFLRPKPNGEFRLILDLTELNKYIEYEHFKMTSLKTAVDMVREGAWMGSVDLKDAYYSVGVDPQYRKLLRFYWGGQLFQFIALPNGLACAPRIFTKLLKPIYAKLSQEGHECFPYIDDSFIVADNRSECSNTLQSLCQTLDALGLVVHTEKSVLQPTQRLIFLGFEIDSVELRVSLTREKREKMVRAATQVLQKDKLTIREVAGLVGLMVSYEPGMQYGGAHVKSIEMEKNVALARCAGDFEGKMRLSHLAKQDIVWWLENIQKAERKIRLQAPKVEICTDASTSGWGAHRGQATAGGRWTKKEKEDHINVLELKAVLFGLKSLCSKEDDYVRVLTDNTTALAYVRNMGGVRSPQCNVVAREIWEWLEQQELWVLIAHIPGRLNVIADYQSRNFKDNVEWQLSHRIFRKACKLLSTPKVDLFASRITKKLPCYVSWSPDPEAWKVDAFSFPWTDTVFYVFPPFSLVNRVLQKLLADNSRAILVVPEWATQPWYGRLQSVTRRKLHFRGRRGNLYNHGRPDNHDLVAKCPLGVYLLWGKS